jgi:N6-L-threonylcarbamoyladenine synthase
MLILGIESSCDETAAALIEAKPASSAGKKDDIRVLSSVVFSQIDIHKKYGGVVPEVAARNHILKIIPVIEEAIHPLSLWPARLRTCPQCSFGRRARSVSGRERGRGEGVAIAVTAGPGLISSLLIGIETAKTLAYAWRKPLLGVNHLAGHIYSAWLGTQKKPKFPALALIVSGGHTELVLMKGHYKFKIIGQTRDDAAGEAFDKAAKILNLGYPGGPAVAKQASLHDKKQTLDLKFPRPMINDNNFDFSFSGIKTSILYKIQKDKNWKNKIPEYCAAFQQAIIDVLVAKTLKAAKKYKVKSVILAGGVAANAELRRQLGEQLREELPRVSYHIPDLKYTTDNAAMIAAAGYFLAKEKKFTPWQKLKVDCNLSLEK